MAFGQVSVRAIWRAGLVFALGLSSVAMPISASAQLAAPADSSAANVTTATNTFSGGELTIVGEKVACKIVGNDTKTHCKGGTLIAKVSGLSPNREFGAKYAYQWYRDGKKIPNATGKSYELDPRKDLRAKISVKVTATKNNYSPLTLSAKSVVPTQLAVNVVNVADSLRDGREFMYECDGGLTNNAWAKVSTGKTWFAISSICGGTELFRLRADDIVKIPGYGTFKVLKVKDFPRPTLIDDHDLDKNVSALPGTHFIRVLHPGLDPKTNTHNPDGWKMHIIAMERIEQPKRQIEIIPQVPELTFEDIADEKLAITGSVKTFTGGKVSISGGAVACELVGQGTAAGCKGSTLTAKVSGLTPSMQAGAKYDYQWYRDGSKITNATNKSYELIPSKDFNATISVAVTATKTGYTSKTVKSETISPVQMSLKIVNSGDNHAEAQQEIYACEGGLTNDKYLGSVIDRVYLPIEAHCGGDNVLALEVGHTVIIQGEGTFKVVELKDVPKPSHIPPGTTADLRGMLGSHLIQTCHPLVLPNGKANPDSWKMRVVGLEKL